MDKTGFAIQETEIITIISNTEQIIFWELLEGILCNDKHYFRLCTFPIFSCENILTTKKMLQQIEAKSSHIQC